MKNPDDNTSYYERNKDKILSDVKEVRIEHKKNILSVRGFPEKLAKWSHINGTGLTLCFASLDELEEMIKTDDIKQSRHDSIESDRNDIYKDIKSGRLKSKRDLLTYKKFPDIIAPWARVNKNTISLKFKTVDDFDRFLSIKLDILDFCNNQRLIEKNNSDSTNK